MHILEKLTLICCFLGIIILLVLEGRPGLEGSRSMQLDRIEKRLNELPSCPDDSNNTFPQWSATRRGWNQYELSDRWRGTTGYDAVFYYEGFPVYSEYDDGGLYKVLSESEFIEGIRLYPSVWDCEKSWEDKPTPLLYDDGWVHALNVEMDKLTKELKESG